MDVVLDIKSATVASEGNDYVTRLALGVAEF